MKTEKQRKNWWTPLKFNFTRPCQQAQRIVKLQHISPTFIVTLTRVSFNSRALEWSREFSQMSSRCKRGIWRRLPKKSKIHFQKLTWAKPSTGHFWATLVLQVKEISQEFSHPLRKVTAGCFFQIAIGRPEQPWSTLENVSLRLKMTRTLPILEWKHRTWDHGPETLAAIPTDI